MLAALGGLLAATAVVTLVIALGSSHSTSISRTQNYAVGSEPTLVFATPCCPQSDAARLPQGAEALVQIVALDTTMSDTTGRGRQGFTLRTVIEPP